MTEYRDALDIYLSPGTRVRYDGLEQDGPEFGIVVYCWFDVEMRAHDCCVAFFGGGWPMGRPERVSYILRYASTSLKTIEEEVDEPQLRS